MHQKKHLSIAAAIFTLLCLVGCSSSVTGYPTEISNSGAIDLPQTDKGAFQFSVMDTVWSDANRDRDIPVKIYAPDRTEPAPTVIFSHGLGGSTAAASYLGEHLASWGYLAIHIQHPGSDAEVWRNVSGRARIFTELRKAARNPENSVNRFEDVPFVIDEILRRTRHGELNANPEKIGLAGHSFGAHTTLAIAGRMYKLQGRAVSFKDPRIKAAIALSPPAPNKNIGERMYQELYGDIDVPILHLTGTEDYSPLDRRRSVTDREIPFRQISGVAQYLVVFDGADHRVFGGRQAANDDQSYYPKVQAEVAALSLMFFDAYLNENTASRLWFEGDGFVEAFADRDRAERRLK